MRLDRTNPMARALLSILAFEAVVSGLAIAGLIQVEGWEVSAAVAVCAAVAGLALIAAGLLRTPVGYPLAWLTQVAVVGLGFATSMMFVVGGMFALLWVIIFVLGRRIERSKLSTGVGGQGGATG